MLKQPLRPPPRQPREAKRGQVPCRARRHPDLRLGFAAAWIRSTPSLSSQRWPLVSSDRLNEPSNRLVRLPLTKQHRTTPLLIGALACHHAIACGLGLLLRNAGGDLRFLAIDAAKADIAISPSVAQEGALTIYLRHRKAKRAFRHQRGAAEKRKAQLQR